MKKILNHPPRVLTALAALLLAAATPASAHAAFKGRSSAHNAIDATKITAENQIKNLIEPFLNKYCREECKIMSIHATVDLATADEISPGFDDVDPKSQEELAPTSADIKILMDEKVGPVTRTKLTELMQQFLDTLDYPVRINTQVTRFPSPVGSSGKINELREKVTKQFKSTLETLFAQFCPNQCMIADYDLTTEVVNSEEAQYGSVGEFMEDQGVAIRIQDISATLLIDESLPAEDRANILEMAKLKTGFLKNVTLGFKAMKFPKPITQFDAQGNIIAGTNRSPASNSESLESRSQTLNESKNSLSSDHKETQTSDHRATDSRQEKNSKEENNTKQENFSRIEKIERVESGDAVQAELQKFKVYGLVLACAILSILIFIALATFRQKPPQVANQPSPSFTPNASTHSANSENSSDDSGPANSRAALIARRYEAERLTEELMATYAQQPKVAKQVFARILTEEGIETTSAYLTIFGESVVMDLLRDPSLQADISELMEFHAKNPMDLSDEDRLDLLKRAYNRTVSGKLVVMGSRSSHQFDFLSEMDGVQIMELIRNESLTVKSIVITQCDAQKRNIIYTKLDPELKMSLMTELTRIDYLPREFISNVANALKRKRRENPRLNTEALPGSEVLLTLLERSDDETQQSIIHNLEISSPDSARTLKSKLVSIETLAHLRDGQLLEVILSLKHDELLNFLKATSADIKSAIFSKAPRDLVGDLEDELSQLVAPAREAFASVERKIINRMKVMAGDGLINLVEINDRMFAQGNVAYIQASPAGEGSADAPTQRNLRKVVG
ncbi:MAG: hypothetical protein H7222_01515 [Methylotenera sp.]|nr:hypothetical protein [Oligoflexia bacterium]